MRVGRRTAGDTRIGTVTDSLFGLNSVRGSWGVAVEEDGGVRRDE